MQVDRWWESDGTERRAPAANGECPLGLRVLHLPHPHAITLSLRWGANTIGAAEDIDIRVDGLSRAHATILCERTTASYTVCVRDDSARNTLAMRDLAKQVVQVSPGEDWHAVALLSLLTFDSKFQSSRSGPATSSAHANVVVYIVRDPATRKLTDLRDGPTLVLHLRPVAAFAWKGHPARSERRPPHHPRRSRL